MCFCCHVASARLVVDDWFRFVTGSPFLTKVVRDEMQWIKHAVRFFQARIESRSFFLFAYRAITFLGVFLFAFYEAHKWMDTYYSNLSQLEIVG